MCAVNFQPFHRSFRAPILHFMYVNVPNDVHLNDENTAHMVGKVQHVDKVNFQHSRKVQMHHSTMMVAQLDCSHPCLDSVFSISYDDSGTRFLPKVIFF